MSGELAIQTSDSLTESGTLLPTPDIAPSIELNSAQCAARDRIGVWAVSHELSSALDAISWQARRMGEDPQDIGQGVLESLVRAAISRPQHVLSIENVGGYLRSCVERRLIDIWRRQQVGAETQAKLENQARVRSETSETPVSGLVWDALERLPQRQREVVYQRFFCNQTEAETAVELSMALGTVKSHGSRAYAQLREGLATVGIRT